MKIPSVKPFPGLPKYRWNPSAKRYIDSGGRFVSTEVIRFELDKAIDLNAARMANFGQQLLDGDITLGKWQLEMMKAIKEGHLLGASLDAGGWYQIKPSDFGRIGNIIKKEYGYLNDYALDIASGKVRFNGHIKNTSRLFGQKARSSYYELSTQRAKREGFDQERSHTTPADHCTECVSEEARGWVKIGQLKQIGDRICRSNCRCYKSFRNSSTKEVRIA